MWQRPHTVETDAASSVRLRVRFHTGSSDVNHVVWAGVDHISEGHQWDVRVVNHT